MTRIADIVEQNDAREAALDAARPLADGGLYDPIRGIASPIDRTPITWSNEGYTIHVPTPMLADPALGALIQWTLDNSASMEAAHAALRAAQLVPDTWPQFESIFNRVRIEHDYEFWTATCVTIVDKQGQGVPLVLNAPQRASFAARYAIRQAGRPMRFLELKFRQYGSTTEKNAEIVYNQNVAYPGHSAYIISLEGGSAAKILDRYSTIATGYPAWAGTINLDAVMNAPNARRIRETKGLVMTASVNNPMSASGDTVQHVLISEAGKFPSNNIQSADRLFTNITSVVPISPDSTVYIESTAEAVGAWFKAQWDKSVAGQLSYEPFFLGWIVDPQYRLDPLTIRLPALDRAANTLEEFAHHALDNGNEGGKYARVLWERGASLQQIAFFWFKYGESGQIAAFKQEYPSEAEEAFQYGARPVFEPSHIPAIRATCRPPVLRGRLVGAAPTGPASLTNIRFEEDSTGPLTIWHGPPPAGGGYLLDGMPGHDGEIGRRLAAAFEERDGIFPLVEHAYAMASDVGAIAATSDPHDTAILDRRPRAVGGRSTIAAELHGRGPFYEWAWHAARLGVWYGQSTPEAAAHWAMEENSIRRRLQEQEGPGAFQPFLDEVREHYPNLYLRETINDLSNEVEYKVGFQTNVKSKGLVIGALARSIAAAYAAEHDLAPPDEESMAIVERSAEAVDEIRTYVWDAQSNGMEAAPGRHDDRVMVRAILAMLDRSMPEPTIRKPRQPRRPRVGGHAIF